ncbi:MAG: NUDIX domain-containing protein [Deltaproteobacteria bacterium]|nr:NUDIX domain-containing protein [Deltaproteobacteria bacterium]
MDLPALSARFRRRYYRVLTPAGNVLSRTGVHPHALTAAGFLLSLLAGAVYCSGSFFRGAWILALAGICDSLDGQIARKTNRESPFGAFFDSTLDRYSDLFPLAGMAYYFAGGRPLSGGRIGGEAHPWTVLVIILAMAGAFMVSYTRARAEGLGVECREGIMQRPERMVLLIIGSFLGSIPGVGIFLIQGTLFVLALTSNATAVSRMIHTRRHLQERTGNGKETEKFRNPLPTVDIIIETEGGIVLVKRRNPPYGWALPGGFVDYGESLEAAAVREAREETSLEVELLYQLAAYSDPGRDPRRHTITVVFVAGASGRPHGADDALEARVFSPDAVPPDLAFDHGRILNDYFKRRGQGHAHE